MMSSPARLQRFVRRAALLVGALALAALLPACTITIDPNETSVRGRVNIRIGLDDVIREFRPNRGPGATYRVDQQIAFQIRTTRPGYVTLSALDPDGAVYAFARNIYVEGGTTVIRGTNPGTRFFTTGPRGTHYVRASFTASPTRSVVVYNDRNGRDRWDRAIESDLAGAEVRDVAQTFYVVR